MQQIGDIASLAASERVRVSGLTSASSALLHGHIRREHPNLRIHVLVPRPQDAAQWIEDASTFLPNPSGQGSDILLVPALEQSPYVDASGDPRLRHERMAAYTQLLDSTKAPKTVVVSVDSLIRKCLPKSAVAELSFTLSQQQSIDRSALCENLVRAGYSRIAVVDDPGTFAIRGDVVDVYSPSTRYPVRIEFFGDEIESLRYFDASTQRTLRQTESIFISPVRETLSTDSTLQREKILQASDAAKQPSKETRRLLETLESGEDFIGIDALLPSFHKSLTPLAEYLDHQDALWIVLDSEHCLKRASEAWEDANTRYMERLADHKAAFSPSEYFVDSDDFKSYLEPEIGVVGQALEIFGQQKATPLALETQSTLRNALDKGRSQSSTDPLRPLAIALSDWHDQGYRVGVVCSSPATSQKVSELFKHLGRPFTKVQRAWDILEAPASSLAVADGKLSAGLIWPGAKVALLSDSDLWSGRRIQRKKTTRTKKRAAQALLGDVADFSSLELGHFLVHEHHGIGQYEGLAKLPIGSASVEFLHLRYDGGTLYVPVYRLSEVQRYVGSEGVKPRLDKLGGATFAKSKGKAKKQIQALAEELLQLYAERAALPGHAFPRPDAMFREFESSFAFEETPDQASAIDEVMADMGSDRPMDRLICGDVGYGKTEVALRAAFRAACGGKQVAFLAPTTILVEQHYQSMLARFGKLPVTLGKLSRFQSKKEQTQTLSGLAKGSVDIVVGTHRLLSKDVQIRDLGLIIIDEEQRFGVAHKERLKKMRSQVDVLALSATPIPRTLHLAMSGLRDLSIIATPPVDRKSIRTLIAHPDDATLREGIGRELSRGGQVYLVTPRIRANASAVSIEAWSERLGKLFPDAGVKVAHGQMSAKELEDAMLSFIRGESKILVSTTIIESGLDIPNANTMFISDADRFGLSQLYQLRGRIGRSSRRAYCYLVVPPLESLTNDARKRLATIQQHSDLGAGFKIASQDLELRGAGDLLGAKQSGSIASVGFSTYTTMLDEAVAELRGESLAPVHDPQLQVDIPSYIPDTYIEDIGQRLGFYKRFSSADSPQDLSELIEELEDRYGPVPEETERLAEVMSLKAVARHIKATRVDLSLSHLSVLLPEDTTLDPKVVMRFVGEKDSRYRLSKDLRLTYRFAGDETKNPIAAAEQALLALTRSSG